MRGHPGEFSAPARATGRLGCRRRPGTPARLPSLADGVQQKAWFCGPPSQVIDGIKSIEAKYPGLEDFMIHWAEWLLPDALKEQLRWFTRDVMPAFNRA
jgi:hypothetical protein